MKALVIADNEKVIAKIVGTLQKFGFETIVYRWLLKALDNISEISPHLIIISAEDYPRHWKTLSQYSGVDGNASKVMLYTGQNFSESERKKADALGIFGTFSFASSSEENEMKAFEDLLSFFQPSLDVSVDFSHTEVEPLLSDDSIEQNQKTPDTPKERKIISCSFVFTNPVSLALVTGRARNFDGETLEFSPDLIEFTENLPSNTKIKNATLKTAEETRVVSAMVLSNETNRLILGVK